jgi:hypothetical protein
MIKITKMQCTMNKISNYDIIAKGQHTFQIARNIPHQMKRVLAYLLQGKKIHRYIAQNYLRVGSLNSRMAEINAAFPGYVESVLLINSK